VLNVKYLADFSLQRVNVFYRRAAYSCRYYKNIFAIICGVDCCYLRRYCRPTWTVRECDHEGCLEELARLGIWHMNSWSLHCDRPVDSAQSRCGEPQQLGAKEDAVWVHSVINIYRPYYAT